MADQDRKDDDPPLVVKERRRGTALTFVLLGLLVLVALFLIFGDEYLEVPPEETDVTVKVEAGKVSDE